MKTMKAKRVIAAALASLCTPIVLAGNSYITNDWGLIDPLSTATIMFDANGASTQSGFMAKISFPESGAKRIYFTVIDLKADSCDVKSFNDNFVILVNGQAIRTFGWCKKAPGEAHYSIQLTASSEQGSQFITKAFLDAAGEVSMNFQGIEFGMSAVGFRKAWNSVSQNAL